jgi:salicylate hydroxylase
MGPGGHILTFPVNHGETLNLVAFKTTTEDWEDPSRLTKPAHQADLLRDFSGYAPYIKNLLERTKLDLDIVSIFSHYLVKISKRIRLTDIQWAIFDLGEHPVPSFNKGRVCIIGDAAHATSPHHGSGAGFCIEDSAILSELLAEAQKNHRKHSDESPAQLLEKVFTIFDAAHRERSQWLVQSSRFIGDCYEWLADGIGKDFTKIESEINRRHGIISNVDVGEMCDKAKEHLNQLLAETRA